jgi:hypothetical protein
MRRDVGPSILLENQLVGYQAAPNPDVVLHLQGVIYCINEIAVAVE